MKKEIAEKWVEALRSGKYQQGTKCLNNNHYNTFCCLGVLCDISGLGEWEADLDNTSSEYRNAYVVGKSVSSDVLPDPVRKWADMSKANATFKGEAGDYGICLAEENDGGATFSDIADLIENNWEKL